MQCQKCGAETAGDACPGCGTIIEGTPKWYAEGIAFLSEQKNYTMAHGLLLEALRQHPTSPLLWYYGGVLAMQMNNRDGAIRCYQEVLKLRPHNEKALQALEHLFGRKLPRPAAPAPKTPPPTTTVVAPAAPIEEPTMLVLPEVEPDASPATAAAELSASSEEPIMLVLPEVEPDAQPVIAATVPVASSEEPIMLVLPEVEPDAQPVIAATEPIASSEEPIMLVLPEVELEAPPATTMVVPEELEEEYTDIAADLQLLASTPVAFPEEPTAPASPEVELETPPMITPAVLDELEEEFDEVEPVSELDVQPLLPEPVAAEVECELQPVVPTIELEAPQEEEVEEEAAQTIEFAQPSLLPAPVLFRAEPPAPPVLEIELPPMIIAAVPEVEEEAAPTVEFDQPSAPLAPVHILAEAPALASAVSEPEAQSETSAVTLGERAAVAPSVELDLRTLPPVPSVSSVSDGVLANNKRWKPISLISGLVSVLGFLTMVIFLMMQNLTLFFICLLIFMVSAILYFVSRSMIITVTRRR